MAHRVLIVDDSEVIRGMLRFILAKLGHEVVGEAGNGADAIAGFRAHRPSLVTLDISLPDMSGIEVLATIRGDDPRACVVAITGNNAEVLKKDLLAGGAAAVLHKPFDLKTLERTLQGLDHGAGA